MSYLKPAAEATGMGFRCRLQLTGDYLVQLKGRQYSQAARFLQLDFDVDAGRQVQFHQGIHRFVGGVHDVHQTAMGADLELVARRLVDVRRAANAARQNARSKSA